MVPVFVIIVGVQERLSPDSWIDSFVSVSKTDCDEKDNHEPYVLLTYRHLIFTSSLFTDVSFWYISYSYSPVFKVRAGTGVIFVMSV